jgi:DnaA-homolog protein
MSRTQMPLALKPPRRPRFDNFVAGDNGALVATLRSGLELGHWYFLAGPRGSGRSHLLAAVLDEHVCKGDAVQFVALADPRQRALLDQASADWILLDDVDRLAGDPEGERTLFNALNRWRAERVGLVMSGRGRDRFELPDLRSRLGQATRLNLNPLEERDLAELVVRLAGEHEVPLGRGVVDYLLSRTTRNAGQLSRLVGRLADRALSERRTVSIPLVRELLGESGSTKAAD